AGDGVQGVGVGLQDPGCGGVDVAVGVVAVAVSEVEDLAGLELEETLEFGPEFGGGGHRVLQVLAVVGGEDVGDVAGHAGDGGLGVVVLVQVSPVDEVFAAAALPEPVGVPAGDGGADRWGVAVQAGGCSQDGPGAVEAGHHRGQAGGVVLGVVGEVDAPRRWDV